ncbi:hypothetical protein [Dokdonella soli]|uniref:Uncharacterized protein n=1 Tax=Dokdonella soli TaxID=529810 RepID=A0ABN1ID16_9GAMM
MNDEARGALLVQQEKLEASIVKMKANLARLGSNLKVMGNALIDSPEQVGFSNAPQPHGSNPLRVVLFDWNEFPDKVSISDKVHELRDEVQQLENVRRQLGR